MNPVVPVESVLLSHPATNALQSAVGSILDLVSHALNHGSPFTISCI